MSGKPQSTAGRGKTVAGHGGVGLGTAAPKRRPVFRPTNAREAYVKADHRYDQRIQHCKCAEKAWNSGEGHCIRCGKYLPNRLV